MALLNEAELRRFQSRQAGWKDPGSSVDMPNFRAPGDQAGSTESLNE